MPILTFPALVPARCDWRPIANTRTFVSPFNRAAQTLELAGALWAARVEYTLLTEAAWRDLAAFLAEMRGAAGRCYFGPPHAKVPRGVATGTPLVKGASQTGVSLVTDGWTPSVTGILKRGDYIAYDAGAGRQLHLLTADANGSNPAGEAILAIEPPIRISPADNAPLIVNAATCVMRLIDDEQGRLAVRPPLLGAMTLDLIESLF